MVFDFGYVSDFMILNYLYISESEYSIQIPEIIFKKYYDLKGTFYY